MLENSDVLSKLEIIQILSPFSEGKVEKIPIPDLLLMLQFYSPLPVFPAVDTCHPTLPLCLPTLFHSVFCLPVPIPACSFDWCQLEEDHSWDRLYGVMPVLLLPFIQGELFSPVPCPFYYLPHIPFLPTFPTQIPLPSLMEGKCLVPIGDDPSVHTVLFFDAIYSPNYLQ